MKPKAKQAILGSLISAFGLLGIIILVVGIFSRALSDEQALSGSSASTNTKPTIRPSSEPLYPLNPKPGESVNPLPTWTPSPDDLRPRPITGFDVIPESKSLVATPVKDAIETWPTATPLPTPSNDNVSKFSAQKISLKKNLSITPQEFEGLKNRSVSRALFTDAAWSSDGKNLALSFLTSEPVIDKWIDIDLEVYDQAGHFMRSLGKGYFPAWSPTGQYLAFHRYDDSVQEGYVQVVEVASGKTFTVTASPKKSYLPTLSWISESELLYFQKGYFVFDLLNGKSSNFLSGANLQNLIGEGLDPSDRRASAAMPQLGLIAIEGDGGLTIIHCKDAEMKITLQIKDRLNFARSVAFSPDGRLLAFNSLTNRSLKIVNVENGNTVELPAPSQGVIRDINWSPNSDSLIFTNADGIFIVNRDGSGLHSMMELPQTSQLTFWASDGTLLQLGSTERELLGSWVITE